MPACVKDAGRVRMPNACRPVPLLQLHLSERSDRILPLQIQTDFGKRLTDAGLTGSPGLARPAIGVHQALLANCTRQKVCTAQVNLEASASWMARLTNRLGRVHDTSTDRTSNFGSACTQSCCTHEFIWHCSYLVARHQHRCGLTRHPV
jgi:hypothetical protein